MHIPHTLCHCILKTLKMWLSKGSVPDSLLQPSWRMWGTDGRIVGGAAATTKGIKSLIHWHTYMVRSDSRHLHCLASTGPRLPRAWISHIHRILLEWGPRVKAVWERGHVCECVGVSLGVCVRQCVIHTGTSMHWQLYVGPIKNNVKRNNVQTLQQNSGILSENFFNFLVLLCNGCILF